MYLREIMDTLGEWNLLNGELFQGPRAYFLSSRSMYVETLNYGSLKKCFHCG